MKNQRSYLTLYSQHGTFTFHNITETTETANNRLQTKHSGMPVSVQWKVPYGFQASIGMSSSPSTLLFPIRRIVFLTFSMLMSSSIEASCTSRLMFDSSSSSLMS
ncbi:hypothetical protein Droror1_Dr00017094 [Drosera rotundifolia]